MIPIPIGRVSLLQTTLTLPLTVWLPLSSMRSAVSMNVKRSWGTWKRKTQDLTPHLSELSNLSLHCLQHQSRLQESSQATSLRDCMRLHQTLMGLSFCMDAFLHNGCTTHTLMNVRTLTSLARQCLSLR